METGAPARVKPFGVEVRNVRCLRCGNYGHQSGDRECPLKDVIMPNEESRLKRDDPLTAIMAQTDSSEVRFFLSKCFPCCNLHSNKLPVTRLASSRSLSTICIACLPFNNCI